MKLTQAQLVMSRAIANSQAVGLAKHKATRTGVRPVFPVAALAERTVCCCWSRSLL